MASAAVSVLLSMIVIIPFFMLMGFIMLVLVKKNAKWQVVIAAGMVYFLAAFFIFLSAEKKRTGHGLAAFLEAEMNTAVETVMKGGGPAGISEQDAQLAKRAVKNFIIKPIYAWIIAAAGFTVLITYLFVSFYAFRSYGIVQTMPQFEEWRGGEPAAWVLIASLAVVLFPVIFKAEAINTGALNVLVLAVNFYILIGMAVASALLTRYNAAPVVRYLFFGMIIFFNSFLVIIILTGILDTWFNFRHKKSGGKDESNT